MNERIKCITFDKAAQEALPEHVKAKMKADREKAKATEEAKEILAENKLFMPARYARYFIEITDVRCERLQSISEDDCLKEGIQYKEDSMFGYDMVTKYFSDYPELGTYDEPREAYATLIDKISGKGTWENNPYVWVYDFKLIEK
jgi:hypothetical protein